MKFNESLKIVEKLTNNSLLSIILFLIIGIGIVAYFLSQSPSPVSQDLPDQIVNTESVVLFTPEFNRVEAWKHKEKMEREYLTGKYYAYHYKSFSVKSKTFDLWKVEKIGTKDLRDGKIVIRKPREEVSFKFLGEEIVALKGENLIVSPSDNVPEVGIKAEFVIGSNFAMFYPEANIKRLHTLQTMAERYLN